MLVPASKKYSYFSVHDSGIPHNSHDYTTLILFHGFSFHSAIFDKFFLLLDNLNVRLVTVNRPDYPGATPLTDAERIQLNDIATTANQDSKSAASSLLDHIKTNAIKTHDFLVEFICTEGIPANGGIILAGWSFGATTILGFLANANAISSKFDLRSYIKHTVLYDTPAWLLGYAPPENFVNPFFDPSLTPGEALKIFPQWLSAYYALNDDSAKLGHVALDHPPPTIVSMAPLDLQRCLEIAPVLPGGSDEQVSRLGVRLGIFPLLREAVLYFDEDQERDPGVNKWDDVAIKNIWCDQSVWEMPWMAVCLQADLDNDKKAGRLTRKVDMLRLRGGNHFCHWDRPEIALNALLSGIDL